MFLGFENLKFCKTEYRLSSVQVQISWLSGLNFMEVSVRPPKHHYDVISFDCVSKLAYFVEHDIGYQPTNFQCSGMSRSNFMEGGNPSSHCYKEIKKSSAITVKRGYEQYHRCRMF